MRLERYEEAVHDFERALTIRLHEIPNFRLFPRLALAYFKAGDREKALVNLELARLSLSVLVGIYRCYDTPSGFVLLDQTGAEVMHPHAGDVQRRMCGGAYEYVYTRQSLESFVRDAQLVEHFLAIAKEIQGTN